MVRAVLYTIAVKKSLKKQNKLFFYIGMVPPCVAASDAFGRTDTRIQQKGAQFARYSCFPADSGIYYHRPQKGRKKPITGGFC